MQFFSYGGYGDRALKDLHYSQAARLPDGRIELSGQGGWDPATGKCKETIEEQVSQAFANIELALQTAGSSWSDVYSIKTYYVGTDRKEYEHVIANLRRWSPERKPIWTALTVPALAFPDMKIEIEAVAYAPKAET